VPNLNHHRPGAGQQANLNLLDPSITSTPKKLNSFISNNSSYSSPNNSSSSNNNSFNGSNKLQANMNMSSNNSLNNTLILSLASKCEQTHQSSTTV
jgi:hypothetical protein